MGFLLQLFPADIEVDSAGNIVVIGVVNSPSYPTLNATQTNLGVPQNTAQFRNGSSESGAVDLFVTKLNPVSPGIVFSTFFGGSQAESGFPSLTIDASNNIYVASWTHSTDYPLLNALAGQGSLTGDGKLALSKFTPAGALAFSTYLGGSTDQFVQATSGVAVNASGKIILAGQTQSSDFPVVDSATSLAGSRDITLSIINQSGDTDTDGDGVPNAVDAFSGNGSEWRDIDGDLTGDNADTDDDGDLTADGSDAFPQKSTETADADNDGAGNNLDHFDADASNYFDLDGDLTADFADTDADADGTTTPTDQFDFDAAETADYDGDGLRNNADTDDDGDGFPDVYDNDPLDEATPVLNFETYNAQEADRFLSPWPRSLFHFLPAPTCPGPALMTKAMAGCRSMSSQSIGHSQKAAIQLNTDPGFPGGLIRFWYKVDSELNGDVLTFSMDAIDLLTASGNTGWKLFSTPATAGVHHSSGDTKRTVRFPLAMMLPGSMI